MMTFLALKTKIHDFFLPTLKFDGPPMIVNNGGDSTAGIGCVKKCVNYQVQRSDWDRCAGVHAETLKQG
jgi:hypothetical protein